MNTTKKKQNYKHYSVFFLTDTDDFLATSARMAKCKREYRKFKMIFHKLLVARGTKGNSSYFWDRVNVYSKVDQIFSAKFNAYITEWSSLKDEFERHGMPAHLSANIASTDKCVQFSKVLYSIKDIYESQNEQLISSNPLYLTDRKKVQLLEFLHFIADICYYITLDSAPKRDGIVPIVWCDFCFRRASADAIKKPFQGNCQMWDNNPYVFIKATSFDRMQCIKHWKQNFQFGKTVKQRNARPQKAVAVITAINGKVRDVRHRSLLNNYQTCDIHRSTQRNDRAYRAAKARLGLLSSENRYTIRKNHAIRDWIELNSGQNNIPKIANAVKSANAIPDELRGDSWLQQEPIFRGDLSELLDGEKLTKFSSWEDFVEAFHNRLCTGFNHVHDPYWILEIYNEAKIWHELDKHYPKQDKRLTDSAAKIEELHNQGKKVMEIARALDIDHSYVSKILTDLGLRK